MIDGVQHLHNRIKQPVRPTTVGIEILLVHSLLFTETKLIHFPLFTIYLRLTGTLERVEGSVKTKKNNKYIYL